MALTRYYTASTLDGFIADEHNSLDWLFTRARDPDGFLSYGTFIADVGALAMGATSYEWILGHEFGDEDPSAWAWPYEQPSWVFTHRDLPVVPDAPVEFVGGDVATVHVRMVEAAAGKDVWIVGGGDLAGQFHDAGLLDEILVQIGSVTLGQGKPLFPRRLTSPSLRLVSVRQVGPGFAELQYEVPIEGRVVYG